MDLRQETIQWLDNGDISTVIFGIGKFNEAVDQEVFYWVDNLKELDSFLEPNGGDFIIIRK